MSFLPALLRALAAVLPEPWRDRASPRQEVIALYDERNQIDVIVPSHHNLLERHAASTA